MDRVGEIINLYEEVVKKVDQKATNGVKDRAYGGIIRADKGTMVERMARNLIYIAWERLGGEDFRIKVFKQCVKIPIKRDYLSKIKNNEVKNYIEKNINKYFYKLTVDWIVNIDNNVVVGVECKAYTENAMVKRILVDFTLLKQEYPNAVFILFQLESQLGGDYSKLNSVSFGSPSTRTILSHFDIDLNIITLLEGERKVDRPIHKKEYYKELKRESIENAISTIEDILMPYK